MSFPSHVKIVEVSPRDGFQNEKEIIPTQIKIDYINRLSQTGLKVIEATSFVSPKWIPQLADNQDVFQSIKKVSGISYPVLIPNLKGLDTALACGAKEIAVFTTPSEEFSQHNTNCSVAESLIRIQEVCQKAQQENLKIRGYISCVLGCPYQGEITPQQVLNVAQKLVDMGCYEISLGDTIGVGTPFKTKRLIEMVSAAISVDKLAVHFHDTFGQALANIYVALEAGISVIDSSTAGLGGCPYAKGAAGNVATEDVLYMLNGMGIETGIDLNKIVAAGVFITEFLNRKPVSKANLALGNR